jgi:hypothetical protein
MYDLINELGLREMVRSVIESINIDSKKVLQVSFLSDVQTDCLYESSEIAY